MRLGYRMCFHTLYDEKKNGLVCKDPERLRDEAKVLGLQVWGEDNYSDGNEEVRFQKSPA